MNSKEFLMKIIKYCIERLRGEPNISKLKKSGLVIGDNFSYGRHCFLIRHIVGLLV